MIFKLLILLLIPSYVLGFDKDFKTVNDRVPLEFVFLFDSMKIMVKTPSEQLKLVGLCKDLDENLGVLPKEEIFLLMKSEVIKNTLQYKHDKVRSFDVTTFLIRRLEESFEKKQKLLTPFSQWIWRAILSELRIRETSGLITQKSFNSNNFQGEKQSQAQRFSRYLTYLMPWIDKMDSLEASDFNNFTKEVSWVVLRRLNDRSLLFKRFASTSAADSRMTIFNIPAKLLEIHPEDIKRANTEEAPLSLKEESLKEKTEATKQVQSATPDDLSPLSEEISEEVSKELDKKTP